MTELELEQARSGAAAHVLTDQLIYEHNKIKNSLVTIIFNGVSFAGRPLIETIQLLEKKAKLKTAIFLDSTRNIMLKGVALSTIQGGISDLYEAVEEMDISLEKELYLIRNKYTNDALNDYKVDVNALYGELDNVSVSSEGIILHVKQQGVTYHLNDTDETEVTADQIKTMMTNL